MLVLSGHSYLHFQRCPDGIWRLQASFGRAGYRTEFRWSGRGLLTGVRDSAGAAMRWSTSKPASRARATTACVCSA